MGLRIATDRTVDSAGRFLQQCVPVAGLLKHSWTEFRAWLALPHVRRPLVIGGTTRLVIFVTAFLGIRLLGARQPNQFLYHGGAPHPVTFIDNFKRFDAYWFLNIARNRYQFHGVQEQITEQIPKAHETNVTPFPLYPMIIWMAGQLVGDFTVGGLLVSIFAFLASLVLFYGMVETDEDPEVAWRATLYLAIYPTAWLYNSLYSESLFLLLALLTLKKARERKPVICGLYGMAASLCRLAGGTLAAPVLAEFLFGDGTRPRRKNLVPGLLAAALVSTGWIAYFSYLYGLTGDFFTYFNAQQGWHKAFRAPWASLWSLLAPGLLRSPTRLMDLGSVVLFFGLAVGGVRRLRVSHSLLVWVGLLMPLCVTNLLGLPRYLMVLFPAFVVLAHWGRRPAVNQIVRFGFAMLMAVMMMAWVQWRHSF